MFNTFLDLSEVNLESRERAANRAVWTQKRRCINGMVSTGSSPNVMDEHTSTFNYIHIGMWNSMQVKSSLDIIRGIEVSDCTEAEVERQWHVNGSLQMQQWCKAAIQAKNNTLAGWGDNSVKSAGGAGSSEQTESLRCIEHIVSPDGRSKWETWWYETKRGHIVLSQWEDQGCIGVQKKALNQATVATLRWRKKPTKFKWVKGHNGHERNEVADRLADEGAKKDDADGVELAIELIL
ncbi:hypothetical protein C8R44DRAFT_728439 [Mycena epipterygia]|nr:hypothetical protein C8R44DRAFT_728439 [Mycena epipterygia]